MIRKIILSSILALGAYPAHAASDINSSGAEGYITRAQTMYAEGNYSGCIDQAIEVSRLHPEPRQAEEASFLIAMASLKNGDDEAIQSLANFLKYFPASPRYTEVRASMGDYWFMRRNYDKALDHYRLIGDNQLNSRRADEILYREAYSNMMLSDIGKARSSFSKLLKSREYRNAALFYLGYLAYQESDYERAIEYFSQCDPTKEPATASEYYLSQIYFILGKYPEALKTAKSILSRDTNPEFRAEANRIAGESLYGLGEESKATPYLRAYVDLVEEPLPSALYILGLDAFHNENYDIAILYMQGATVPDDAMGQSAWLYLGQSYVKTGNMNGALMAFEKAAHQNFDSRVTETAMYDYAVARLEGGRVPFGSSVGLFEEFLRKYPDSKYAPKVQEYIITGYLADNDYEAAIESVSRMRNPSKASVEAKQRALFLLGTKQFGAGRTREAAKSFLSARAIDASDEIAVQSDLWLGDCHFREGNYSDAVKSYESFIRRAGRRDPNYALALYDLGYAYFSRSDYGEADRYFRQSLDAVSSSLTRAMKADAYDRIGDCLYYQHKFDEAAAEYRRAYDANPSSGDYALYQLAIMKGLARDHKGKISSLNSLMDEFPSSALVPAALLEKAESYTALDNTDNALGIYQQLVNNYSQTAYGRKAQLRMAITLLGHGDRQRAVSTYKKVVTDYPTSEEAKIAIDDLKRIYADDGMIAEFTQFVNSVPQAPRIDPSELESLAFEAAERAYLNDGSISKLTAYVSDYPSGAFRPQAIYNIAEAKYNGNDLEGAYGYLTELATDYPDADVIEDALRMKAETELAQGKNEIALDTYRLLERKSSTPQNLATARMGILNTAQILGLHKDAVEAADKLLATTTGQFDSNEVHFLRAAALNQLRDYDEAEVEWRLLAKTPSDIYGAKSAVHLAQTQLERGQIKNARTTIDNFLNANTPHQYWQARGFIVLSDILRRQGETFEADEYLKSLRSNYPGSEPDIFQMIDERLK